MLLFFAYAYSYITYVQSSSWGSGLTIGLYHYALPLYVCVRTCVRVCANSKGSGETSCFQSLVYEFLLLAYSMSTKNILYELPHFYQMGRIVRTHYLLPRRVVNAQPSLRICTDSTEPFMLTYKCIYLGIWLLPSIGLYRFLIFALFPYF